MARDLGPFFLLLLTNPKFYLLPGFDCYILVFVIVC